MAVSVGFIGVGNMGNPMANNVLKAGFPMAVFDKSAPAMANLVQAGAHGAASAREVVERSEITLTCLPASPDVEALYLEPGGLIERAKPGTTLVDLSSVLPSTPRKLEPRAKRPWPSWWAATRRCLSASARSYAPLVRTSSAWDQ